MGGLGTTAVTAYAIGGGEGTAWLIAITGAVTGIGALVMNRRGQKEQNGLEKAAQQITADKNRLEETDQAITSLETALTRAEQARDRAEAEAERYRTLHRQAEDENGVLRTQHQREYAMQEARCREYASDLTDAITVLRRMVSDEIAVNAAVRVLKQPQHPHGPALEAPTLVTDEREGDGDDPDVDGVDGGDGSQ